MIDAVIPMPLQIVIDDVGWWCGPSGEKGREPFRTGMPRNHVPGDYAAIVSLGRKLGMRPQAAMILCEWDRDNILRATPWATWMGENWDNTRWVGPWLEEAAHIMREGVAHFEFTLHGVGHEYWPHGTFTRAEWHDAAGMMRPRDHVLANLDSFQRIMERNNLGAFPESFVPCAFKHAFGCADGLAGILRERGIRYLSTPFSSMIAAVPPQEKLFGIDGGIMTVDRGNNGVEWNTVAARPMRPIAGPIYGLHWPNLLHTDPARNGEVIEEWAELFRAYDARLDAMLSPSTAACWTQLAYKTGTTLTVRGGEIELDFSHFDQLAPPNLLDTFVIKVRGVDKRALKSTGLEIIAATDESSQSPRALTLRRSTPATRAIIAC